jgi:hypothetical protein
MPNTTPENALVPREARSWRASRPRFFDAFKKHPPMLAMHEDACVKILMPKGWGMQEIEVLVQPDLNIDSIEKIERSRHHDEMKEYFESEIDIIPKREPHALLPDTTLGADIGRFVNWFLGIGLFATLAPLLVLAVAVNGAWLAFATVAIAVGSVATYWFITRLGRQLTSDQIWPGLMEERLAKTIKTKFKSVDGNIRHVIDRYADVFLDNNWMFLRLKRLLQAGAIAALYAAMAPVVVVALFRPDLLSTPVLLGCLAWAGVISIAVMWTFNGLNDHIYDNKYLQTLQNSAMHVSTLVRNRMASIFSLYQHTLRHITELQQKGEPTRGLKDDVRVIDDIELMSHEGFMSVQTMIWLAKRNEYIELHLHNRLHHLLTVQSVLSVAGFVASLAIFLVGFAPALMLLIWIVWTTPGLSLNNLHETAGGAISIAAVAFVLLGASWLSWESYFEEKWNPLKTRISTVSILDEHFDTHDLGGWQTYKKIKLDVNLAGAFQKTLGVVSDLFQKLGQR